MAEPYSWRISTLISTNLINEPCENSLCEFMVVQTSGEAKGHQLDGRPSL